MKKCKYCYSEIDERATVCPICKKKLTKKKAISYYITSIIALLIISFSAFAIFILVNDASFIREMKRPSDIVWLFKFGEMDCAKEETDEDGYISKSNVHLKYSWGKLTELEEIEEQQMSPDYIDFTYEIGKAFAEKLDELDGIEWKYEKINENTLKTTSKINYKEIDLDELEDFTKEFDDFISDSEDSSDNGKIYLKDYKRNLKKYTCEVK